MKINGMKIFIILFLTFIPFFVNAESSQLYIDYPLVSSQYGDKLYVQGWFMSNVKESYISISLDDIKLVEKVDRYERQDVLNSVTGYCLDCNLLPGYRMELSLNNFKNGIHKLTVSAYDSQGNLLNVSNRNFNIYKNNVVGCIDEPNSIAFYGEKLVFSGWIMSTNSKLKTNIYIDDNLVDADITRYKREDVINAIFGYGDRYTNIHPGFSSEITLQSYRDGVHNLKVECLDENDKVVFIMSRKFNVKKNSALINLDYPTGKVEGDSLDIYGWIMGNFSNYSINTYIDNNRIAVDYQRYDRPDVLKAINFYEKSLINEKPGFLGKYNVTSFDDGKHVIRIDIVSPDGNVITSEFKEFFLTKYTGIAYIDNPIDNGNVFGTSLDVSGWVLSNDMNDKIEVYIDNLKVDGVISRKERLDVNRAYPNLYGGNSYNLHPGYFVSLDLIKYHDGEHHLKVCVVTDVTQETLNCYSKKFNLTKYSSTMILDYPLNNDFLYGTSLLVSGWLMSTDSNANVSLFIDGNDVSTDVIRYEREDVLDVYSNLYGGRQTNIKPGFKRNIDVSSYKDGYHTVSTVAYSNITNEVLYKVSKRIYIKKNQSLLNVDYPLKYNFSNDVTLVVQGWELSDFRDAKVRIFMDSIELPVSRENREDVFITYQNLYGGRENNEKPGFVSTYSLIGTSVGEHTIKICIYNYLDEIINSEIKKIYVYDNIYFGIDVSSHQSRIDWGLVSKAGIDFAILRVGYGDNWKSQDDVQFLNNVNGVTNNHIPYGVYIYSYATNLHGNSSLNADSASIDSEIAHTLRLLNSINDNQKQYFKLPVFLDMEDDSTKYIGKSRLTQFADYFCGAIEQNGYKCGVYANKNWLTTYLDSKYLVDKYDIWLAHYTDGYYDMSDYTGKYHIWQYSSTGHLNGVNSSYLDMDISYKKYW